MTLYHTYISLFPLPFRPVILYTTPQKIYINDVTTMTKVGQDLSAEFSFNVSYFLKNEEKENIKCVVQLLGKQACQSCPSCQTNSC